jgi:hypothetical protein
LLTKVQARKLRAWGYHIKAWQEGKALADRMPVEVEMKKFFTQMGKPRQRPKSK